MITVGVLALNGAAVFAAQKVEIAKKGSYVYWFSYKDAEGQLQNTLPERFKGKSASLNTEPLGEKPAGVKLYVMNRDTGNMAISDFAVSADEEAKPIKLTSDDFQYVRNVRLRIISEDGKPLENAIVNITDGMNTAMRAVVTPADEGVAVFTDVATGEINVKVEAKNLKRTIDSDIELPEDRKTPGFARDIKVTGDVDTIEVAAAAAKPAAKTKAAQETRGASSGSILLQTLAGLIFVAVLMAVVFVVLRARGVTAKSALSKMGVEMPETEGVVAGAGASGAPAAPAVDPNVCQFCGQRKDASGNCACSVTPGASPFGGSIGSAPSAPRLVGVQGAYSGHIFELESGSTVIGREAGNEIALTNDSTASRRHATITSSNGDFIIRDEGSSNGIFVNGAKITQQKLTPGDEIQIGGTKFRFEA